MPFNLEQLLFLREEVFDQVTPERNERMRKELEQERKNDLGFVLAEVIIETMEKRLDSLSPESRKAYEEALKKHPSVLLERRIDMFMEMKKVIEEDIHRMKLQESLNKQRN